MSPSFEAKTSLIQFCSLGKDSQRNKATLGLLMTKIVFFNNEILLSPNLQFLKVKIMIEKPMMVFSFAGIG